MKLLKNSFFLSLFIFSLFFSFSVKAQIINSYAKITALAGTNITISAVVGEVNETAGAFAAGQTVIVMQMQDNVIGTTTDVAGFGNVGTIASAGLYEVSTIIARTGTSITLATLTNTFNVGANSSLQLISFPTFCTRGATTGLPWNGNIGGVIAFRCAGTMTLNGTINGNGIGFRGGAVSANVAGGCGTTPFRANSTNYGEKGESIYKINTATTPEYRYALARLTNGGGGGIYHNGGGGGGGNFTAGGQGGNGWDGSAAGCTPSAGGYGGTLLSSYINLNRAFMGGGGGGANQNNGFGTAGVRGGGIVIIEANQIITSCPGPVNITVNGETSGNTTGGGNDSAGGAGGSIIFRVNNFTIAASCPITATANGGFGGTANFGTTHGGGGGGGQGVVIFANGCPNNIQNINVNTNNGIGGCNNSSNPCNSYAGGGSGVNGTGIICDALLPIEWLSIDAEYKDNQSFVTWKTTVDKKLAYFEMERSTNGKEWKKIGRINSYQAIQSTTNTLDYEFIDRELIGQITYYRINQFDKNGSSQYSPVVAVNPNRKREFSIYPNPAKDRLFISYANKPIQTKIVSSIGKLITINQVANNKGELEMNISHLSAGIYLVLIELQNGEVVSHKFIVEK